MCRSDEERKVLRVRAKNSKERESVISVNDGICKLNGMTEGEDRAKDSDREDDEDEREMESTDWKVRVGPRGETRTRSNSHPIQRLVHTLLDVLRKNPSPRHQESK